MWRMVPFLGSSWGEKPQLIYEFHAFQRDVDALVESADYKTPELDLTGLEYDPLSDEFSFPPTREPDQKGVLGPVIGGIFGLLVVTSLFRTVMTVQWRKTGRALLTTQLGAAPKPIHDYRRIRSAFNTTPAFQPVALKNHSHGLSAANRLGAIQFMNAVCVAVGLTRYSFQMSNNEQNLNVPGERMYYWAKDASAEPQFDVCHNSHVVTLIDVDYYVDMPDHLAYEAKPHLLYTVQPETAGRINGEYSYSFDSAGRLNWKVAGGASYTHSIWNYGIDCFLVTRKFCGLPYKAVMYDVQARRLTPDKQVVLLAPIRIFYGLSAVIAWFMAPALARLNPVVGKFAKVVCYGVEGKTVSVAPLNTETSCTIPSNVFDSLLSTRNISPQMKLNAYQTKSMVSHVPKEALDAHKDIIAPFLTEYLNTTVDRNVEPMHIVPTPLMTQVAFDTPDPSDKPVLTAFAKPFGVPPAFVPVKNKASSDQSIIGRVLLPREQVQTILGEFKMTPLKQQCMEEFVRRLIPEPHLAIPYDFQAVAEKQIKPGQKRDLLESGLLGVVGRIVKTFMKAEAYGKPTDPRNISTFNAKTKVEYAHYIYPLMDHMKQFAFYAFGRTPREVAERVAGICFASDIVACPDIHRMDGFVNNFCRQLEKAVGCRFFAPSYVSGFVEAHDLSHGNVGVTTHGLRYEQEDSRGSGEMGTSVWNTILNLFMVFYAKVLSNGRDYDGAWKHIVELVIAGGDDGLVGNLGDEILVRAARDLGFILKCPIYSRDSLDIGVNFLARIYGPHVWSGDPNSMCSLRRQMEKLHLTVSVPISPSQKLFEKALSFSYTDSETPLLGKLCAAVMRALPGYTTTNTIIRWGDDAPKEDQYPNNTDDWMDEVAAMELPLTNSPDFTAWLDSMPSIDELLNCPVFYEEGREFTYDEYDPTPGLVIKRTLDVLVPKKKKMRPAGVSPSDRSALSLEDVDLSKVKFMRDLDEDVKKE